MSNFSLKESAITVAVALCIWAPVVVALEHQKASKPIPQVKGVPPLTLSAPK